MLGGRKNQSQFSQYPTANVSRSVFDRSHTVKDTFNADLLTPCYVDEVLPGDTINLKLITFMRLATQKVPFLDNLYVKFYFFFVPNRLVWENWERFMGAQDDPDSSTDYEVPFVLPPSEGGFDVGSLFDHFGVPTEVPNFAMMSLPLRGYIKIWNDWFRDQNLQDSYVMPFGDGPDGWNLFPVQLLPLNKKHDYFTSAFKEPQKGAAIQIPLADEAPITGIGKYNQTYTAGPIAAYETGESVVGSYDSYISINPAVNDQIGLIEEDPNNPGFPNIRADTTELGGTIEQLRQAFQIQALLEANMRGGTRYVEIILAHFNVVSPDFRLQRSEYLGGGSTRINVHPVAQTSPTSGSNAQAQLASFATQSSAGENIGFTKSFVEHGYVIGLMAAAADITYQQGLNKLWSRKTKYDYFWPKLQQLGEQAILNREIFASGDAGVDETVWGYQERYAEYRFKPSEIRGQFRSTYAQSLDVWHLAEEFNTLPPLNDEFIQSSTPMARVKTITDAPDFLADMWFDITHVRPVMARPIPASLGRF